MKRNVIGSAILSCLLGSTAPALAQAGTSRETRTSTDPTPTVEKQGDKPVPFYGFGFDFTLADSSGLNSIGRNYRNDLNFYFEPSWHVGERYLKNTVFKTLEIDGRFAVTQNLSGTDDGNFGPFANQPGPPASCPGTRLDSNGRYVVGSTGYCNILSNDRRADYSDIWLTVRTPKIYTIPRIGVYVSPSMRFYLPTSAESRFATLALGWLTSVSAGRTFWKDRITLGTGFGILKNFHTDTQRQLSVSPGGTGSTLGGNPYDGVNSVSTSFYDRDPRRATEGPRNTNFNLIASFSGAVKITDQWSFDLLYLIIAGSRYGQPCMVTTQGVAVDTCATGNAVAAGSGSSLGSGFALDRPGSQIFWATLAYQPLSYLTATLMWINSAPLLNPDSTYRQGIVSTNYDAYTTIQLGLTVSTDKLAAKLLKY